VNFLFEKSELLNKKNMNILDVGCGYGEQDVEWRGKLDKSCKIKAIDISEKQISYAIEKNKDKDIRFEIGDAMEIDKNYYDTDILYPELNIFKENFNLVKNELLNNIEIMKDWLLIDKNDKFYKKHTIIPIFGYNKWSKYCINFPITVQLVKSIKNIETCCFLKLSKNSRLDKHYGYNPSSNYILRSHLGLSIPKNCGMWVNGEIKFHQEECWITFDDSKLHTAFNNSNQERYILLIDMKRPDYIKIGNSLREDNYDQLIDQFINNNI
jgi:SAM-dependent methyltransferase